MKLIGLKNKHFTIPLILGIVFYSAYIFLNRINFFEENHHDNVLKIEENIKKAHIQFLRLANNNHITEINDFDEQSIRKLDEFADLPFFLQIYKDGQPTYWTNNSVEIDPYIIEDKIDDHLFLQDLKNGSYIVFNKRLSSSKNIVGILPVESHYSIENKYLKKSFNTKLSGESGYKITTLKNGFDVVIEGEYLFSIEPEDSCKSCNHKMIYFFLFFVGIFLILYSIHVFCVELSSFYPKLSFLLLLVLTYSLRHYLLKTQTPSFLYMKTLLFDSKLYFASKLNPSLGDFLLFVFWCNWMLLYFNRRVSFDFAIVKNRFGRFIVHTLILIFLLGETVSISKIFENMVLNSSISFDFNFFPKISRYSIIGISSLLLCFANYFVLIRKFVRINVRNTLSIPLFILSVAITLGLYYYLLHSVLHAPLQLYLIVIIVMSIILLIYYYYIRRRNKAFYIPLLFLVFSSTSSTILLDFYNTKKQERYIDKLSVKLASERDTFTELSFMETKEKIKKDIVFQIYFESSKMPIDELKDYLIVNYLGQYASKYNIQLSTYDSSGNMMRNADFGDSSKLHLFSSELNKVETSCPELFFVKNKNRYKYYSTLPIQNRDSILGYIVLELKPKQIVNNNLYPELLLMDAELNSESYDNINFAVYSNNELIVQKGSYPHHLKSDSSNPLANKDYSLIDSKKFKHQFYHFKPNKVVVISTETSDFLSPLSLLSYIFCFYLVLYTLGIIFYNIVGVVRRFNYRMNRFLGISLRTKINLFIILL
nr:hypothetical protein [Chitinophagales bacterium]